MTCPAANLGMSPFQGKECIPFMHEFLGCPQACRSVATLAAGLPILLELSSVNVLMAGRTFSWSRTIPPDLWASYLTDRPFNVTMLARCLSMGPSEGKTCLFLMIIRTELERRAIRQMADRTVALLKFLLELPSVGVRVAYLACLGCGFELPHLGFCIDEMALDTGHGSVGTQ